MSSLTASELRDSERVWIRDSQMALGAEASFKKGKDSLGVIERDGVLICKGRLQYSDLDLSTKFPFILAKDHLFANLVIRIVMRECAPSK